MSITLHYIDDNWKLNNCLLHTDQFSMNESKTGENIRRFYIYIYNLFININLLIYKYFIYIFFFSNL